MQTFCIRFSGLFSGGTRLGGVEVEFQALSDLPQGLKALGLGFRVEERLVTVRNGRASGLEDCR